MSKALESLKYLLVVVIGVVLFSSCDEEDNKTPVTIEISYDSIGSNVAEISWSHQPFDGAVYEIYFEGNLVYEGAEQHFTFTGLLPATTYTGTLIGYVNGTKLKYDISFKTQVSLPPAPFKITEIRHINEKEVILFYDEAIDPENESVTYELYVKNTRFNLDQILVEPGERQFRLSFLVHSCEHAGQIVAIDESGKRTAVEFEFKTQTPPPVFKGNLIIYSQFEIEVFPYTNIEGTLDIWGETIRDISNLSKLKSVWNELSIDGTKIRSTQGLENVEIIETSDRRFVAGRTINITNNESLQTIVPMPNVTVLAGLTIVGNDSLKNIDNFSSVTKFYGEAVVGVPGVSCELTISKNKMLENIDGLSNVETFGNPTIEFSENSNLKNLNGLLNARIIGTHFPTSPSIYIASHPRLANLCGVSEIVRDIYGTGWFNEYDFTIKNNVFNPTIEDFLNGNCAE